MERYCFLHKDYEPPTFRALDPWELQIEHICRSISMRTGLLRRLGCHPHGLACSTARLAACTLTDAVSIINSEVWSSSCPESQYHDIAVALNIIYRRLLGVEAKTASVAVWHELGVASVATRIDAAALKFRNNILSLDPRDFLVRRVYDGLMNDSKGRGSSRNGALFPENLALEANWPGPLKKPAAKKFVNEFVASRRVSELADGFKRT